MILQIIEKAPVNGARGLYITFAQLISIIAVLQTYCNGKSLGSPLDMFFPRKEKKKENPTTDQLLLAGSSREEGKRWI